MYTPPPPESLRDPFGVLLLNRGGELYDIFIPLLGQGGVGVVCDDMLFYFCHSTRSSKDPRIRPPIRRASQG